MAVFPPWTRSAWVPCLKVIVRASSWCNSSSPTCFGWPPNSARPPSLLQCCSGRCYIGTCRPPCPDDIGEPCDVADACCSGYCLDNKCAACTGNGQACAEDDECEDGMGLRAGGTSGMARSIASTRHITNTLALAFVTRSTWVQHSAGRPLHTSAPPLSLPCVCLPTCLRRVM